MDASLFHFCNEDSDKEYVVILEPADEKEFMEDAEADGYKLFNKCPLENAQITLPLRTVLTKEY